MLLLFCLFVNVEHHYSLFIRQLYRLIIFTLVSLTCSKYKEKPHFSFLIYICETSHKCIVKNITISYNGDENVTKLLKGSFR